jgi:peptide/nickel transport system ATP-binding protein
MTDLLRVADLHVRFAAPGGFINAVKGVSFRVRPRSTVALVGESGSGKSVVSQTILRILPRNAAITKGQVLFADPRQGGEPIDLAALPSDGAKMRAIRGGRISIIFQEPMTSLSPLHTIGNQVGEALRLHRECNAGEARELTADMLRLVGFPDPQRALKYYPFELSGGLRQRAMIAMALVCRPALLIADEPTTALDVTIQAQILALIKKLRDDFGTAVVLITHDMGVVADIADRVAVMYAGRVIEEGPLRSVFYDAQHPYTWGLLGSIARLDRPRPPRLTAIRGLPPSLINLPEGCAFGPRCPHRFDRCAEQPRLEDRLGEGHQDACHLDPRQKKDRRDITIHPELAGRPDLTEQRAGEIA